MQNEFSESFDNPQVQNEHAAYSLHGDVQSIRDLLAKCENPVALTESLVQIGEVIDDLNLLYAETEARITRLYFPAPLVGAA